MPLISCSNQRNQTFGWEYYWVVNLEMNEHLLSQEIKGVLDSSVADNFVIDPERMKQLS